MIFLTICGCLKHKKSSQWSSTFYDNQNPFLTNSKIIEFSNDSICFISENNKKSYCFLATNEKFIIQSETTNWLMEISNKTDSTFILTELYSKNPTKISLKKIK